VVEATGDDAVLDDALATLEADGDVPLVARSGVLLRLAAAGPRAAAAGDLLARAGLRAGVGAEAGLDDGPRAARTARYARAQTSEALPVVGWDDLVDDGVLAVMGDAARTYGEAFLGPLTGRPELRTTLQAFLRHHGSRGQVAAELGVHRNTVRHRVAEIEAALGRSLDDPATRVNAWVALHAGAAQTATPGR
jgi:purine catabolism regulator